MNIQYLKYAVEVAKTGSINKAAENLFMAQPNLSRAIKELETSLGIVIFVRNSKGMTLTEDGEKLVLYAKKIIAEVDGMKSLFKKDKLPQAVFSVSVPRASYISHAFSRFTLQVNEIHSLKMLYCETNSQQTIENVLNEDYNLGIIRFESEQDKYFKFMLEDKGLKYELVTEFEPIILMNKAHPLAVKDSLYISDLVPYIEVVHADRDSGYALPSGVTKSELNSELTRRIFVYQRASEFEILSENNLTFMWVSPMPIDVLEKYNLVSKKVEGVKHVYRDIIIYKKNYNLNVLDKCFITELCKSKRAYFDN